TLLHHNSPRLYDLTHLQPITTLLPYTTLFRSIYQRQKEIENFKKETFYELESVFSHEKGEYKGKANIKEKDKKKIESIINNYNRSEEHTSELQSRFDIVCRLLLEKKKKKK